MKATKLDTVVFEYPQEVLRECHVMESRRKSAAGTDIVSMAMNYTPTITLSSAEDDWLSLQNITDIQALCGEIRDTPLTLFYDDGSSEEVLFDHTKPPTFNEIMTGTCFYYGTVTFSKYVQQLQP